jgi:chemotaxis methyl-accepting protein methylase/chemotaxis receptor (MCP) glutamine deamidase CheD
MDALIDKLKEVTGLKFDQYQRNFLEKRIDFRIKNLKLNYHQYIEYIRENPIEVDLFLDKFTINYTYFFRNLNVFENFEKFIKFYVRTNKKSALKIWSAPCATGDEPFTIAMILDNLKNSLRNFPDFEIFASDIDTNALKIANEGSYGEYAVHEMPKHYLNTYFSKKVTELGPKYILSKEIKSKVEFIQEDIIREHKKNNVYDVIFCRNFFIYINQSARENLLRNIDKKIHEGGLLILGGSENIPRENSTFNAISIRDHFYIKNLFNKTESYQNALSSLFQRQGKKKAIKKESISKRISEIKESKKESISLIKTIKLASLKLRKRKNEKEKELKELEPSASIEPADVRITELVTNNRITNKDPNVKLSYQLDPKEVYNKKQQKKLKQKELLLKQREEEIEEKIKYLEEQYKILEYERKEVKELHLQTNEKEKDITNRLLVLERVTRQIEQRKKALNLREEQLEKRIAQMEQYSKKMIRQELQINHHSKELVNSDKTEEKFTLFEEKRIDRVKNPRYKKELTIKMGYYGLIHSFDQSTTATKFRIEGLGSGTGLILRDPINHVFAMSHISLPNSSASKQGYHLLFPHTFADTSVKDLLNNLLYNGANKEDVKALIVGGAKLFLDYDMTYQEIIDTVKKELKLLEIEMEAEDIGGLSERSVIYDTINDSLYVKKSWEFQYRRII